MKELKAVVTEEDNGTRVWKYVLKQWKAIVKSREQMRRSFKRGEVLVNDEVAEITKILAVNDTVQLNFDNKAAHASVFGQENLDVRFEDDHFAVVVKPSGTTMVTFGFMLQFSLRPSHATDDKDETTDRYMGTEMGAHIAEEAYGLDHDDYDQDEIPTNISPTLGQQYRVPCAIHGVEKAANGLVLVAKTKQMRSTLLQMHKDGRITRTYRVVCHGAWKEQSAVSHASNQLEPALRDDTFVDADCIDSVHIVQITPSNEAGSVSTLNVIPRSSFMGVNIRRYLLSMRHPVVGESGNTRPLKANRNKGLFSALVKLEFIHPLTGAAIAVQLEEPAKFEQLRIREQRACQRRQANDQNELKKGGLELAVAHDRKADLPIAYLVGEKDFYKMRFKVSPATLIPRPSTETLVEASIALTKNRAVKILDVGTGSGCLLLALLHSLPLATGTGVDISKDALDVAKTNATLHGLTDRATFQWGDMGNLQNSGDLSKSFDLLVCNPPYLDSSKASKLKTLFAGTEYEPPVALFAKNEGYGAYELLAVSLLHDLAAPGPDRVMADEGYVILEIGSGMRRRVEEIFKFLSLTQVIKDNQGGERCLVFSLRSLVTTH
ncbi:hypothetical protein BG011_009494 [Mortierella polycephala]|uniref:S-adenosyl-L-methionine-dependent methyltransferase n=1 Tax=Mortierella polycephala TaxID=41804 RepID=A0A9P6PN09_9FUNG|nr:hypothetical protein BG011_009494 [Mortierella polycephala]